MKNLKIIMTMGLPASGKSTWSREQIKNGFKIVNKDLLREMLHNSDWNIDKDKFILKVRDSLIKQILQEGFSVIVDDTNFASRHEKRLREIAEENNVEFEINDSFCDVPLDVCIERDSRREKSVGEKVIRGMYDKYLKEKNYVVKDEFLPEAIICDIDGTLAHHKGRSPFDWKRVGEDSVDELVKEYLGMQKKNGKIIILVSGRDEVCRPETEEWLYLNKISYDYLFMRPEGNNEKDYLIKNRILVNDILNRYNPILVLDDRNQTVNMWRNCGLTVWQVAEGNF